MSNEVNVVKQMIIEWLKKNKYDGLAPTRYPKGKLCMGLKSIKDCCGVENFNLLSCVPVRCSEKIKSKDCDICEEIEETTYHGYSETKELCPYCNVERVIYYKQEGRFINNHCSECHGWFGEDYPTLASALRS